MAWMFSSIVNLQKITEINLRLPKKYWFIFWLWTKAMLCFASWWDEELELKKTTAKRFSRLRWKETKVTDQCDTIVIISRLLMNSVLEAKATTSRASTFQTFFQTSHCCARPGCPFNSCWLPKIITVAFGRLPVCLVLYIGTMATVYIWPFLGAVYPSVNCIS